MSYILDALKKSEQEKQKAKGPSLEHLYNEPPATADNQPKRPRWLVGLIAANVVVIVGAIGAYFYWSDKDDQITQLAVSPVPTVTPAAPTKPLAAQPATKVTPTPVTAKPPVVISQTPEPASKPAEPTATKQAKKSPTPTATKPQVAKGTVQFSSTPLDDSPASPPAPKKEQPPLLFELSESFQRSVPKLKFNAHFFSTEPNMGSVIVNGQYHYEGSELEPGLVLEEITPIGVILTYQGTTFRMEVLGNWVY